MPSGGSARLDVLWWDPTLQQGILNWVPGPCQAAEGFVGKPGTLKDGTMISYMNQVNHKNGLL